MFKGELLNDILSFMMILSSDGIFYIAPIVYPYILVYYKKYDENVDMIDVYSAFCGAYFGRVLANFLLPSLIMRLGVIKTLRISALLYLVNFFIFALFPCKKVLFYNAIFYGIIFQFKNLPINYFLAKKYENGIFYLKHIYIGISISSFLWAFVSFYIVNPYNQTVFELNDKMQIVNFNTNISDNVPNYFYTNGIFSFIVIYACTLNLVESSYASNSQNQTELISKEDSNSFSCGSKEELCIYKQSIKSIKSDIPNQILKKISFKTQNNNQNPDGFIYERSKEENKKEAVRIMFSLKFMMIASIMVFKSASCSYFIAYSKYISYFMINNDKSMSFLYGIISFNDTIFRYVFVHLLTTYGFFNTNVFLLVFTILQNFIFILFGNNSYVFIILWIFVSINYTTTLLLTNLTLFSFYTPEIALLLSRVIEMHSFLVRIYCTTLNWYFINANEDTNYTNIFCFFCFVEIISLVLFYYFFKNKEKKIKKNTMLII